MSTPRKTCDKCKHYKASNMPESKQFTVSGACALMGDSNDAANEINTCAGWDYEGYRAGVYVGPKFGCIHWTKKEKP